MLKKIQKEVEDLRIKVYAGQSLEDTDKALYEIEQMLFKAMDEQLSIPVVSITEGQSCKCGNKTFTHRHTNWIECTSCNQIKVLQD